MLRLQEKLRLEMTPEEAEVAFQQLIDDSVYAVIPVFVEALHRFTQGIRS